jgi:hypothetical protein
MEVTRRLELISEKGRRPRTDGASWTADRGSNSPIRENVVHRPMKVRRGMGHPGLIIAILVVIILILLVILFT